MIWWTSEELYQCCHSATSWYLLTVFAGWLSLWCELLGKLGKQIHGMNYWWEFFQNFFVWTLLNCLRWEAKADRGAASSFHWGRAAGCHAWRNSVCVCAKKSVMLEEGWWPEDSIL